jgi:hypothetical protein
MFEYCIRLIASGEAQVKHALDGIDSKHLDGLIVLKMYGMNDFLLFVSA